ncbi:MAG TPA: tetratricopeptide repeat protein [Candidatus Acidoferrum sp.]
MSPPKILLRSLALAFSLISCAYGQRGMQSGPGNSIDVQVRYADGSPGPAGLHIVLNRGEGGMETDCQTVQGGRCRLQPGSSGVYIVNFHQIGYADFSERVELVGIFHAYVTITLHAEGSPAGTTPAGDAPTGSVSVSEVNIPENARKEYAKGVASLQENQPDAAAKYFQKAVKLYGGYAEAYRMLGEIYLEQRDLPKAEASLKRSIELEPKLAAAYIDLGALRNQTKEYAGAEQALKKGLELNPDAAPAKYELAKTYWALGRWQEAAPYAEESVKALPGLAPARVLLGNIQLKRHDPAAALREYQEYLRLDPGGPMAVQVREAIAKIEAAGAK